MVRCGQRVQKNKKKEKEKNRVKLPINKKTRRRRRCGSKLGKYMKMGRNKGDDDSDYPTDG